jgi:hypothetical protein
LRARTAARRAAEPRRLIMALALAQRVLSFPKRRPFAFGVGFSAAKTSFADYLVQKYVEKREEIDIKRNMTFGIFGLGYLGARAGLRAAQKQRRVPFAARRCGGCAPAARARRPSGVHSRRARPIRVRASARRRAGCARVLTRCGGAAPAVFARRRRAIRALRAHLRPALPAGRRLCRQAVG